MSKLLDDETIERLRKEEAQRQMMRWRKGVAISVLLAGLIYLALQFGPRNYAYHNYDRFYGFGVDFVAEGERHTLYGELHCRAATYEFSLAPEGNRPGVARGWKVLTKRLSSGAAIAVDVPNLCTQRTVKKSDGTTEREFRVKLDGRWRAHRPSTLPDNYLPSVHWFDNAEKPTVIEQYVERSYYGRTDARVKVLRVWATVLSDADPVDPTAELPFLNSILIDGSLGDRPYVLPKFNKGRTPWQGVSAVPYPEEIWSLDASMTSILSALDEPTELSVYDKRFAQAWDNLKSAVWAVSSKPRPFFNYYVKVLQLPERSTVELPDGEHTAVPVENILAFRRRGASISMKEDDRGAIAYYPVDSTKEWPEVQVAGLQLGERCKPLTACFVFDPRTRTLYAIQKRAHALANLAWSWVYWNP